MEAERQLITVKSLVPLFQYASRCQPGSNVGPEIAEDPRFDAEMIRVRHDDQSKTY